jgi:hypothetical protein
MDKTKTLIQITLGFCLLSLLLSVADFGAFTDIYHDFMGTRVPEMLDITVSDDLLARTSTTLEWRMAQLSWFVRVVFFIFCAGVMIRLSRRFSSAPGKDH